MRNRVKTTPEPRMVDSVGTPFEPAPKQVVMYYAKDDDLNRLYTVAHLEQETIDRIADRVIAKLDMRREKVIDLTGGKKRRGKKP